MDMAKVSWGAGAGVGVPPSRREGEKDVAEEFSKMVQNLMEGKPANYDEAAEGEDTTTITQVLSDGSVLITVMQGDEVISQSKTHAAHPKESPALLSTTMTRNPGGEETASPLAALGAGTLLPDVAQISQGAAL